MCLRNALLVCLAAISCAPAPDSLVIIGGRRLDIVRGELVDNGALVVRDGLIAELLAPGQAIPEIEPRIDATGATITPGLFESHGHLVEADEDGSLGVLARAWEFHRGVRHKRDAFLDHGITSVRDPGGSIDSLKVRNEEVKGPHLYTAGRLFTAVGGYPAHTVPEYLHGRSLYQVGTVEEARRSVEEASSELDGVDFVKVIYSSGVLKEGEFDPEDAVISSLPAAWFLEAPLIERDVLSAIIDEAHERGLRVAVHTDRFAEARVPIELGADYVHHAWPAPDEADAVFAEMAARGVCYNPTLDIMATRAPSLAPPRFDTVRRAFEAGVPIAAGSDTGSLGAASPWGESLHEEMKYLVAAGLPAIEVWRAATITNALCLGLDDKTGSLDVGKDADIALFAGDPVSDLASLDKENVLGVWVAGERLR